MKKLKTTIKESFSDINPVSKYSLKYGLFFSAVLFFASITAYIVLSRDIYNWRAAETAAKLCDCAVGSCVSVLLSSFIGEMIVKTNGK